ncbi:MAG: carboxypeptidase regulatory-like domain-containing protein [Chloroflexi bacterium]|nr:carboxypeptidase regulatory-like domain-containing protein [Chloroflexota bacterium]MCI0578777.1 carboxypeptidase regulatory-like domain-containing protein [Chloroflexota bacterium]MCI0648726.1 carboxypeptidase regulatory-like domain-containing protein [Chloroflexota bacterium]MCI0731654.1 carboxypeptidase regulatory-like domain-containing protein [Chloroflexota bacterium]
MRENFRFGLVIVTCALVLILVVAALGNIGGAPAVSAKESLLDPAMSQPGPLEPVVLQSTRNDTSLPLADLVAQARPNPNAGDYDTPLGFYPTPLGDGSFDPAAVQDQFFAGFQMPLPIHNFEGIYNIVDWPSVGIPPDTNGDVGYDSVSSSKFYVQWVNTTIQAWDVTDPDNVFTVLGPAPGNVLFAGFGGPCETTNSGDPIVLFDQLANRWLASQFVAVGPPFYQCVAISATADPTGSWHRYAFVWPNGFNDYPKFGVWPDAYYMSANQFTGATGAGVAALERSQMLIGAVAQFIYFDVSAAHPSFRSLLPSDLDGPPPPPGTPNYFAAWHDSATFPPNDAMKIWEFHVDFVTPANSTFGLASQPNESVATINVDPGQANIPMPGGVPVDSLAPRLMFRLPYRYVNGTEILVANHTVDSNGANHAGVHWMELRKSGGPWSMYQESVYAPDADHRWMGAIAMDQAGNIALGYSVSSQTAYPSIRYAGRLAGDPLGSLMQIERELVTGSGFQEHPAARWGDYSSMNIDPTDDCTFWYTQEYYAVVGARPWQTRIGSFVFPGCLGNTGTLDGTVTDSVTTNPINGATIQVTAPLTHTEGADTDGLGEYGIILGAGSYSVTAAAYGYASAQVGGVTIVSGTITTQDFALTPSSSYLVEGTVMDGSGLWPLYAHVTVQGDPFDPPAPYNDFWTDPDTGYYSVTLAAGITYTFEVQPDPPGYPGEVRSVGPLTSNSVEDFSLTPDLELCRAPGYSDLLVYFEDFEAGDGGYVAGPGEWEWGIPTFPPGLTAHSGVNVWGTDLNGSADDVVPPNNEHVLTATLSVPAGGGVLQWWDYFRSNDGGDQRQVRVNGTTVWDSGLLEAFQPWTKQAVDLSAWAGQTVDVAFVLAVSGGNPGPDGWYFDDVSIAEPGTCNPYGVTLSPDTADGGPPGTAVTYVVTITNIGGVTDTFDLSFSGNSWSTSLSVNTITLGPGQSGTFMVTVSIPPNANPGDDDTVMVTASSQTSPLDSDSVNLTTTALERRLHLPVVLKN